MDKPDKSTVVIGNTRRKDQLQVMKQIQEDGVCPFCRKYFEKYHPKPILKEGAHWIVTENGFPYKGTRVHILLVYKTHITHISEISTEGFNELLEHVKWVNKEYCIEGGVLIWRFGDPKYNGSSVHHLHAQIIVGDIDDPLHKPVRVKVG